MQDVQVRGIASEWQNEISFYTLFVYRGDNLKSTPVYYQDGNSGQYWEIQQLPHY